MKILPNPPESPESSRILPNPPESSPNSSTSTNRRSITVFLPRRASFFARAGPRAPPANVPWKLPRTKICLLRFFRFFVRFQRIGAPGTQQRVPLGQRKLTVRPIIAKTYEFAHFDDIRSFWPPTKGALGEDSRPEQSGSTKSSFGLSRLSPNRFLSAQNVPELSRLSSEARQG